MQTYIYAYIHLYANIHRQANAGTHTHISARVCVIMFTYNKNDFTLIRWITHTFVGYKFIIP